MPQPGFESLENWKIPKHQIWIERIPDHSDPKYLVKAIEKKAYLEENNVTLVIKLFLLIFSNSQAET